MANDLVQNLSPEIIGPRLTVYNLLSDFLDPTATETYICQVYSLTPEQVAAARAYILNNPETVLARHLELEARIAKGNPPEVIERAKKTQETFIKFKEWLVQRREADARERMAESTVETGQADSPRLPTFREWLAEQGSRQRK